LEVTAPIHSIQKSISVIQTSIAVILFISFSSSAASFALGADVSWLLQMEAKGYNFHDDNGVKNDCLTILKEHNINSIRLRIWVNPSNDSCSGHCSKEETVSMAKRAALKGFRIMIDFHYSDSWADPGKQTKPAQWSTHASSQLQTDVYNFTFGVLDTLIKTGVHPEWVQVGNEINDGMLWEDGRASKSFSNLSGLITSGYNAVKAADSTIKVIVHVSNGYDNSLFRWMFDSLTVYSTKYDCIGMSLYPSESDWQTLTNQCLSNMNDVSSRYGKEVIITETGMPYDAPDIAKSMLTDLVQKTGSVDNAKGVGVFYWEPECYNWCGYSLGAWNLNGSPTSALDAFLNVSKSLLPNDYHSTPLFKILSAVVQTSCVKIKYKILFCKKVSCRMFNQSGKEVLPERTLMLSSGVHTISLNIAGLAKGFYFIKLSSGNQLYSQSVIIR
jgi:arabinogalactan endo-1,4-beta-galactosidase